MINNMLVKRYFAMRRCRQTRLHMLFTCARQYTNLSSLLSLSNLCIITQPGYYANLPI